MWRKDKAAYKTWLTDKISDKDATARSHGFRFRGQYEEELKQDLDPAAWRSSPASRARTRSTRR